ncbi:hypothetical protein [Sphingomonas solaris]|uniref:Uncharacterized protein n=1 Tax=Alterirhizorhabdus solaris TaxID=2529389 RepID=A0A558R5P7_9SPHN|nr:hypothetical protein [Sphingomonas solaris]TVV74699.1 hypothetical protein FOY91_09030 [Sphingomonas solaris]
MSRLDRAYTGKLEAGVMRAIVDASMTEQAGERVAFLMSAEIVDVLVGVVAGVVSGSESCASPSSRRRFCDELARRLQRRIAAFQDHAAEHGRPFPHATINPS